MADEDPFPVPPQFSAAEIEDCRKSGDYRPIFFEWYKYVGLVSNHIASIDRASPAARPVAPSHFGVLIGLLNRCSRLMLANLTLSNEGLFGETTAIVDRCIFESCVKVQWLCKQVSGDFFERFIADGLKTELELKSQIETRIASRGGAILPIEERMLDSIERFLRTSSLNDGQIKNSKKLPDLAAMLVDLGKERLTYVVGQKMPSHHVHGTWPSLLMHYLEWDDDGNYQPRDNDVPIDVNQYVFVPLVVLHAAKAFVTWLMDESDGMALTHMLQSCEDEIQSVNRAAFSTDFRIAEQS